MTRPYNARFMAEMLKRILNDENHPLRFLIDLRNGNWRSRSSVLGDEPAVQAGHLVSNHALRSGVAEEEEERLAIEDGWNNNTSSRTERHGAVFFKSAVLIGGVPVELRTALDWVAIDDPNWKKFLASLPDGKIENAPKSEGWTPQASATFTRGGNADAPNAAASRLRQLERSGPEGGGQ